MPRRARILEYTLIDGNLHLSSIPRPVQWERVLSMDGDMRKPNDFDRLNTLTFLLDFRVIKAPKEGTPIAQIIPDFATRDGLSKWRQKKVRKALGD